jgi:hypothetical protein
MATVNSDFVDVQLSAAGIAAAGAGGTLRITAHRLSYEFKPGERVRILTSEWAKVLAAETLRGQNIFELAPAPKASSKTVKAAEAATQTETAEEGK